MCRKRTIFQTFLLGENQSGAQSKRLAARTSGYIKYLYEIDMKMTQKNRIIMQKHSMTNTAARWEND
ncbi:hypothetical protein CWS43_02245 [Rahnella sp. AA]|nr:hypothetical protein CWS43_02245 [Rahnella sp. AA]